jgi:hypothetical protein
MIERIYQEQNVSDRRVRKLVIDVGTAGRDSSKPDSSERID